MRIYTIILAAILLTLTSTSAMAEWTYLTSSKDANYYVDNNELRKNGNKVKMWAIIDFKSTQKLSSYTYLSMKSLFEFDCVEVTAVTSSVNFFSGNMSSGDMIFHHKTDPTPHDIAPDSSMKTLWETACGKK